MLTVRCAGDTVTVAAAPISHSPPRDQKAAIEIPASVKVRLGLDQRRSWIVTNEVNAFEWPGPDLRPIRAGAPAQGFAYGYPPQGLATAMIGGVRQQMRDGQAKIVNRDVPA